MTDTPLDRAWTAAAADETALPRFWDMLAASELFLPIDPETLTGGAPQPLLFPVEGVETALAFDTEERLAGFMEGGTAHLTLSGRAVVGMFAGSGVQLGLNLGEAPSATILPAAALDWAAAALAQPVEASAGGIERLTPPAAATPELLAALDAKLNALGPAVAEAWLCGHGEGLILMLAMRAAGAEEAAVAALAETARFSGGDAPAYDIAVLGAGDARLEAARRMGLGFEPEDPEAVTRVERVAPGMDKAKPPKLR